MPTDGKTTNLVGAMVRSAIARSQQLGMRGVNSLLHPLECALLPRSVCQPAHPPVFIIGAPRSGSTVIYQTLVNCLEVGFFSNLHEFFYGMPTVVERWYNARARLDCDDYESTLGLTHGWHAPSECGAFWYRFYPRDPAVSEDIQLSQRKLARLTKIVARLTAVRGCPFVIKNLYCSLRLSSIHRAFPKALFLVVRRDEIDTGQSLLAARNGRFGQYEKWFSVKPPAALELESLPPHQQVIEQVRRIYDVIDRQRMRIGRDRFLDIHYERFCDDPPRTVEEVREFTQSHGLTLNVVGKFPQPFRRNGEVRVERKLYDRMVTYARAS